VPHETLGYALDRWHPRHTLVFPLFSLSARFKSGGGGGVCLEEVKPAARGAGGSAINYN